MFLFVRCFIHSRLARSQALRLLRLSSLTPVVLDVLVINMYVHAHSLRGLYTRTLTLDAPLERSPQLFYGCGFRMSETVSAVRNREASVLGGWFCTKVVVISIRATDFVRCREVVLLSEGPTVAAPYKLAVFITFTRTPAYA